MRGLVVKKTSRMDVAATFENMASSLFYMLLGVGDVLQEIRDKGDCYQQTLMARALKKPVVLLLDRKLHPLEQAELRNCLEGLEIIGTVYFDSEKMDDSVRDELGELLESWKRKTGGRCGE